MKGKRLLSWEEFDMHQARVKSGSAKAPGSANGNAAAAPPSAGEAPVQRPPSKAKADARKSLTAASGECDRPRAASSPPIPTLTKSVTAKQLARAMQAEARRAQFRYWCECNGIPIPYCEFKFHDLRRWRFDYAWPKQLLAVEVEGGLFSQGGGGRHNRGAGMRADMEKYNAATMLGWRVLRYLPEQLQENAMRDLRRMFA